MNLLVDGSNMAYRAFYGMPTLTRASDGFPTGAIYGFTKTLFKLMEDFSDKSATLELFWDRGAAAREDLQSEYKANRKPTPPEMVQQMPYLEKIATLMGITSWLQDGVEADDLIGSRANLLAAEGHEVLVVSADKDFAQLVNENISLYTPPPTVSPKNTWKWYTPKEVVEKFGVQPCQIVDYLALMGDSADNIMGLEGVGPKTAAKWLNKYGDIEGILNNSGKITPARFQNIVYESKERLLQNREMTTLQTLEMGAHNCVEGNRNGAALVELFTQLEMKSTAAEAARRFGVAVA